MQANPQFARGRRSNIASLIVGAILVCGAAGCLTHQLARCPLDQSEVSKQILAIAPVGTPRDDAIKRLNAAGIQGEYGSNASQLGKDYYCCQSWRRSTGEEWRISLLLHFDKTDKLCETLELPDLEPSHPKSAKRA